MSRPLLTQEHTWLSDKSTCRFFFSKWVKPHIKPCIFLDTRKTIEHFSKMGYACIYILQGAIGTCSWSILAIWQKMTIFKVIYVPQKRERQFNGHISNIYSLDFKSSKKNCFFRSLNENSSFNKILKFLDLH